MQTNTGSPMPHHETSVYDEQFPHKTRTERSAATGCASSESYTIPEATDGNGGVNIAKKRKPDLILMDVSLPGIDGITAFGQIRTCPETMHIAVIAVTASALTDEPKRFLPENIPHPSNTISSAKTGQSAGSVTLQSSIKTLMEICCRTKGWSETLPTGKWLMKRRPFL
jgi:CheY-like chemotaxis protein